MDARNYTSIGPVLHLNKAGELAQKRMKAAKLCDGLYITEPDKTQFVKFIIEYNGVKWVEHQAPAANVNPANMAKRMPAILASIEDGRLNELNDYHKELHRRIFNPDAPAIMELKKPERKKTAPLAENERKVSVLMFKGCTAECIADTPKPREMAQKEPKQVIRNSRTTQQRTIKRFLIVQSVPRLAKCSTAHYIAGASKMVYSGIIPSGYAPPIRGDCKLSISTRAKPPNRARSDRISNYKPP